MITLLSIKRSEPSQTRPFIKMKILATFSCIVFTVNSMAITGYCGAETVVCPNGKEIVFEDYWLKDAKSKKCTFNPTIELMIYLRKIVEIYF